MQRHWSVLFPLRAASSEPSSLHWLGKKTVHVTRNTSLMETHTIRSGVWWLLCVLGVKRLFFFSMNSKQWMYAGPLCGSHWSLWQTHYDTSICSICLESLNDEITLLFPCSHLFHTRCMRSSIRVSSSYTELCPNCRASITALFYYTYTAATNTLTRSHHTDAHNRHLRHDAIDPDMTSGLHSREHQQYPPALRIHCTDYIFMIVALYGAMTFIMYAIVCFWRRWIQCHVHDHRVGVSKVSFFMWPHCAHAQLPTHIHTKKHHSIEKRKTSFWNTHTKTKCRFFLFFRIQTDCKKPCIVWWSSEILVVFCFFAFITV
jgi:hypothetical protein